MSEASSSALKKKCHFPVLSDAYRETRSSLKGWNMQELQNSSIYHSTRGYFKFATMFLCCSRTRCYSTDLSKDLHNVSWEQEEERAGATSARVAAVWEGAAPASQHTPGWLQLSSCALIQHTHRARDRAVSLTSSVVTERYVSANNSEFLPDQFRQKLGVPRGQTTHQPGNLQKKCEGGQHGSASFTSCDLMTKQLRSIVPSKINHLGLQHWEQADCGDSNGFCGHMLKNRLTKKTTNNSAHLCKAQI